jgi:hypothetical protein
VKILHRIESLNCTGTLISNYTLSKISFTLFYNANDLTKTAHEKCYIANQYIEKMSSKKLHRKKITSKKVT